LEDVDEDDYDMDPDDDVFPPGFTSDEESR